MIHRIVVSVSLDVLSTGPVDMSTSPVNSSLGVGSKTTRPKRELHASRSLWEHPLVCGRVPGILAFQCTSNLTIDQPGNLVRSPVDFVGVVIVESVRKGDVGRVPIIRNTLEIEVGLSSLQIDTDEFVIDFILDIRKQDECSNNTRASTSLECSLHVSVPHVCRASKQSTDGVRSHCQKDVVLIDDRISRTDPVCL